MSANKSQEIDASLVEGFNNLRIRNGNGNGNQDNNNRQHVTTNRQQQRQHHRVIYNSNNNNYRSTTINFNGNNNNNRYRQQRNFQRNLQQLRQQQQQQHYQSRRRTYASVVAGIDKNSADQQQHQGASATEATQPPTATLGANASTFTAPRMQVNQVAAQLPPPPPCTEPSHPQCYCMQQVYPSVASRPTEAGAAAAEPTLTTTPSTTTLMAMQQQQRQQQQLPLAPMPSANQRSASARILNSVPRQARLPQQNQQDQAQPLPQIEPRQMQRLHEPQMPQTLPIEEAVQQLINTPTAEFYVVQHVQVIEIVTTSVEEVNRAIETLLAHDFHVEVFESTPETFFEEVPRGLTATQIEDLPSSKYNPDADDSSQSSCVVCMCEFERDQELSKLPCSHEFHAECVGKWLETHRTCPVCRHQLFEETDEIEVA